MSTELRMKLLTKLAVSQDLKEIIENAASYGKDGGNGMMNFISQLKADKAKLSMNITATKKPLGGLEIKVSPFTITPIEAERNYGQLSQQVENYLNRNIIGFPQIKEGAYTVTWDYSDPLLQQV